MFARYRAVFRAPGSARFCTAAFVMRMPIAMYPIGIVLILSARDGRYGFGGALSACYIFGNAVGAPLLGRLVDRYGQRRLLLPCGLAHAVAGVTLALLLSGGASHAALVAPTLVFGFSYLSVASLVRARWAHRLQGQPELATALSLESVLDEAIFVFGPLITTLLATQTTPVLVIYVGVVLVAGGTVWLAMLRDSEPPPHPPDGSVHESALRVRGMIVLVLATIGMGAVFASAEVAMIAFSGQHGHRSLSGLVLAGMAFGSGISGLVYGAIHWRSDVLSRFRIQAVVFGVLPAVLFAGVNLPVLAICGFVLGLGIAPTLITAFALIQQMVPARALTEGLSWASTGLSVGYGAGAALVGGIADHHGARTAFLVVLGAGLATGALAALVPVRRRGLGSEPAGVAREVTVGTRWED